MRRNVLQPYARQWPPGSPEETPPCPVLPGPGVNPVVDLQHPLLPGDLGTQVSGATDPLDPPEGRPREAIEVVAVLVLRNLNLLKRSIDPIVGFAPVHFIPKVNKKGLSN